MGLRRIVVLGGWLGGFLLLGALLFALSFHLATKLEMRSSEVSVPDLTGLSEEQALSRARSSNLLVEVVDHRHDPRMSSGRILQQEPEAGASVRRGRRVKVVMSLGGKVLLVPDLRAQGARAAEIDLRRAGFVLGGEARVASPRAPSGAILAQVPPPGSPSVQSTRVHLLVSEGQRPERWVMPDLGGLSRGEAETWIQRYGFRKGPVRVASGAGRRSGVVIGQSPLAGYPIGSRAVVELTVAE